MTYRVFDKKTKQPILDHVFLSPNGRLMRLVKMWFFSKLIPLSADRFVVHRFTCLQDKHGRDVFEGDICVIKDGVSTGIVTYLDGHASFYLIDDLDNKYYPLSASVEDLFEVVGNVIQNPEMVATAHVE